jgi:2',3'-cyclic-nucleotide 2'-phosphodiesterase (5'-nucleotidase family)
MEIHRRPMLRPRFLFLLLVLALAGRLPAVAPPGAEALVIVMGDQHSAYERTAQFVALVDRLKAENPARPMAVLLDGDTMEYGNVVARRSEGEIDYAMFAALAKRAPTILNLGNHESEFADLAATVKRIEATGVRVVSNIANAATGEPFAPGSAQLALGPTEVTVLGVATDNLATYRKEVRPTLGLAEPVKWAQTALPPLRTGKSPPIVMSHAGLAADREMLALVPDGTLFAGAHDHLRFVERMGRTAYFHSGSWNEYASLAWLCRDAEGARHWEVEQVKIAETDPADPELATLVREVRAKYLTPEDLARVGQTRHAMAPAEAARFVVKVLRESAKVDAAFAGNTTFGAGLPAGDVTQTEFDACVRFDGQIFVAEVDGTRLQQLLAAANQGPDTPFAQRLGDFMFADGPQEIDPARRYRIATTDWGAKNTAHYFGEPAIEWKPAKPELNLKPVIRARLARDRVAMFPEPKEEVVTPTADDLFAMGKELFDTYAPDEVKAEYEFPSKREWDEFAQRLQAALESNDLNRLAAYEPEARAALVALSAIPEYSDYANWLAERLDYIEAAKSSTAFHPAKPRPPASAPVSPAPSPATPSEPADMMAKEIPNYAVWLERVRNRPAPPKAEKLLPRVQEVFASEGVPPELAWMAEAESTFNPAARSPVGAKGLFQLMPDTAKSLGLRVLLPDERVHPEKSARAAAQYLRRLYQRFGDWLLALAAYNAGEGRVSRTLKAENTKTFAGIAAALPAETRMYVPKVLATIAVRTGVPPDKLRAPGA